MFLVEARLAVTLELVSVESLDEVVLVAEAAAVTFVVEEGIKADW